MGLTNSNVPILGTNPVEVHSSMLNNLQLAITWATKDPTATSTMEYGLEPTNLNMTITNDTTRTYTAGGWVGVIHEVSLRSFYGYRY